MKFKSLFVVFCFCLFNAAFAENQHAPSLVNARSKSTTAQGPVCRIKIVNNSQEHITVFGIFDDTSPLHPFNIYKDEYQYINLYYNGACHLGMNIRLVTFRGLQLCEGYVYANTVLYAVYFPNLKQTKVEVRAQ